MADITPDKLEVTVPVGPHRPDSTLKVNLKKDGDSLNFSKDTLLYFMYLMYKTNMVSRVNLKQMFRMIDQPMPENVVKWLLEEAAKA